MTRAERQKQKELDRLYVEMVAAVRAWFHLAHPYADRITVTEEYGDHIRTRAAFHAWPGNEWTRGDLLAMGHRI